MKELNSYSEVSATVQSNNAVVIDVWAEWCGPCRQFGPTFEAASKEFGDKVVFVKVNIDDATDVASALNVQSIPTVLFMKNGIEVHRQVGSPDSEAGFKSLVATQFDL